MTTSAASAYSALLELGLRGGHGADCGAAALAGLALQLLEHRGWIEDACDQAIRYRRSIGMQDSESVGAARYQEIIDAIRACDAQLNGALL